MRRLVSPIAALGLMAFAVSPTMAFAQVPPARYTPTLAPNPPSVYPGCLVPPAAPTGNIWHFDPVNGQSEAAMTAAHIPLPAIGQGPSLATQGGARHPWSNLQSAFLPVSGENSYPLITTSPYRSGGSWVHWNGQGANPAGPIQPGDVLMLNSGNYGIIGVGASPYSGQQNILNGEPAFITIEPAPGAQASIPYLTLFGAENMIFNGQNASGRSWSSGLTIGAIGHRFGAYIITTDGGATWPTSNLIFENMTVQSAPPSVFEAGTGGPYSSGVGVANPAPTPPGYAGWLQNQWLANVSTGFLFRGTAGTSPFSGAPAILPGQASLATTANSYTNCIAAENNLIQGVADGFDPFGTNSILIQGNVIGWFSNHGVTWGADNNFAFLDNFVHDPTNTVGGHIDGMQQTGGDVTQINISNNIFARFADPNNPWVLSYLQCQYDASYQPNLIDHGTINGNVCLTTRTSNGIAYTLQNSVVENNTMADDGLSGRGATPGPGIGIAGAGSANNQVLVANNIALILADSSNPPDPTVQWVNNFFPSNPNGGGAPAVYTCSNGSGGYRACFLGGTRPFTYHSSNLFSRLTQAQIYQNWTPGVWSTLNMQVNPSTPAFGRGNYRRP